jgi:replicative DNA helicase
MRTDIPPRLFRQLLMRASEVVQKLLAKAKPETQTEIQRVLAQVTDEVAAKAAPRNYAAALAAVRRLHSQHKLGETDIADFARSGKYEETIAALAILCAVPVEVVDRLMNGERSDPVLILARASGFGWQTVKAILNGRSGAKPSPHGLDVARENFERLTVITAQRVVRFWQVRQDTGD